MPPHGRAQAHPPDHQRVQGLLWPFELRGLPSDCELLRALVDDLLQADLIRQKSLVQGCTPCHQAACSL
eukprot:scaffold15807_cov20-Tisochrysis_lutea.AAC.1